MNVATLQLPPLTDTARVVIVGMSGSGKSTGAKAYLAREVKRGTRIVFFDPDDEYSDDAPIRPNVDPGPLRQRVTFEEFERSPGHYLNRADLALAVVPDDDPDVAAEQFARLVEQVRFTGNLSCGADELGGFAFDNDNAHEAKRALNLLCTKLRKCNVSAVLVSQRMVHVPRTARTQASALAAFYQNDPEDLDALERITGDKTFSQRVATHRRGEASLWVSPLLAAKDTQ